MPIIEIAGLVLLRTTILSFWSSLPLPRGSIGAIFSDRICGDAIGDVELKIQKSIRSIHILSKIYINVPETIILVGIDAETMGKWLNVFAQWRRMWERLSTETASVDGVHILARQSHIFGREFDGDACFCYPQTNCDKKKINSQLRQLTVVVEFSLTWLVQPLIVDF